jgi:drug/metabolite transporter (DMT)-like permease
MKWWLMYVVGAGLCWGTYVPLIQFGGKELKSRYGAMLCVGVAYFLIAVLFPLARFMFGQEKADWKATGITFATLAGAAGALGALCVIYATAAALPGDRIYIAPLIFTLAPILNTLVSLLWHPTSNAPWTLGLPHDPPGWKLYVGILLAAIGAGLVLYSKEESESKQAAKPQAPAVQTSHS